MIFLFLCLWFLFGLGLDDIELNYLKNVEEKVTQIFNFVNKTNKNQLKGAKQKEI